MKPPKKKAWPDSMFENSKGKATPFSKEVLARRLGKKRSNSQSPGKKA